MTSIPNPEISGNPTPSLGPDEPAAKPEDFIVEERSDEFWAARGKKMLPLTDLGNASRLHREFGHAFRHNTGMGWLHWDSRIWRPDDSEAQVRLAAQELRLIIGDEANEARMLGLGDSAKKLGDYIPRAQSKAVMANALSLWQPRVFQAAGDFDRESRLVTVDGGVLALETRKMRPYDPALLFTRQMPVAYDPAATCPWFEATLAYFVPERAVREYLQRWAGYCLTSEVGEQQFSIWHGQGANGKSTVLEGLRQVFGTEGGRGLSLECDARVFEPRRSGNGQAADPDRFRMRGMKLITAVESAEGFTLDSSFIKSVTGGEAITARDLYRSPLTYKPTFKVVIASNHEPDINDDSEGMWRRVHLVPFEVRIPDEHKLPWERTVAQLRAERSGILNWCLDGFDEWRVHGLAAPPQVSLASAEMRLSQDWLGLFLHECTVSKEGGRLLRTELWERFDQWRHGDRKLGRIGRNQFYVLVTKRLGEVDSARCFRDVSLVSYSPY